MGFSDNFSGDAPGTTPPSGFSIFGAYNAAVVTTFGINGGQSVQVNNNAGGFAKDLGTTTDEITLYMFVWLQPGIGYERSLIVFNNTIDDVNLRKVAYVAIESDGTISIYGGDDTLAGNTSGIPPITLQEWTLLRIDLQLGSILLDGVYYLMLSSASVWINGLKGFLGSCATSIPLVNLPSGDSNFSYLVFQGPTNGGYITNLSAVEIGQDDPFKQVSLARISEMVTEWSALAYGPNARVSEMVTEYSNIAQRNARVSQLVIEWFGKKTSGQGSVYEA